MQDSKNRFIASLHEGTNTVRICAGAACRSKAEERNTEKYAGKTYTLKADGKDSKIIILVEAVPCFKACALMPVVQINGKLYGNMDWEKALEYFREKKTSDEGNLSSCR